MSTVNYDSIYINIGSIMNEEKKIIRYKLFWNTCSNPVYRICGVASLYKGASI